MSSAGAAVQRRVRAAHACAVWGSPRATNRCRGPGRRAPAPAQSRAVPALLGRRGRLGCATRAGPDSARPSDGEGSMTEAELDAICAAWPGVTRSISGEVDLVYSVANKMFAVLCLGPERGRLSFKVEPERFLELTDQPGIAPAPYMARAFWITLANPGAVRRRACTGLPAALLRPGRGEPARKAQASPDAIGGAGGRAGSGATARPGPRSRWGRALRAPRPAPRRAAAAPSPGQGPAPAGRQPPRRRLRQNPQQSGQTRRTRHPRRPTAGPDPDRRRGGWRRLLDFAPFSCSPRPWPAKPIPSRRFSSPSARTSAIFLSKLVAAVLTGSGSMLAEAVHSLADCGNQGLLLLGLKRAKRPPSPDFPWATQGHLLPGPSSWHCCCFPSVACFPCTRACTSCSIPSR